MSTAATPKPGATHLTSVDDYLGLSAVERYKATSEHFPPWLVAEPIQFPPDHPTYGWACMVNGCEASPTSTSAVLLCTGHAKQFSHREDQSSLEDFVRGAQPIRAQSFGRALTRRKACKICGTNREAYQHGYCATHSKRFREAKDTWASETAWQQTQKILPPLRPCSITGCVHDGELTVKLGPEKYLLCRSHFNHWRYQTKSVPAEGRSQAWITWFAAATKGPSVAPVIRRGQLSLAKLPCGLQQEIRYAIHRHAKTPRRAQWRPPELQKVVNMLANTDVQSLTDPVVIDLTAGTPAGSMERRILLDLPVAARSLIVSADVSKEAGWFDPILVGGAPFRGADVANRRKPWDLTAVSQRWLRDLLWDYLRDEALKPKGKRPTKGTVNRRVTAIALLSYALQQIRDDYGGDPHTLSGRDAKALKEIWDLWFHEQLPLPSSADRANREPSVLNKLSRHSYMSSIRIILRESREKRRTSASMDLFILSLPDYPRPPRSPRPRPLTYGDFKMLVDPDNIRLLENADRDDVGLADIWLVQAFQGGRISETIQLRLGCVGLVGDAQPYIWRDIKKVNVVDYGMPCYLPVYQRLLERQNTTRVRLRRRYADKLAQLDDRGRMALEAHWDREMPLFPAGVQNPDLVLEVSTCGFRDAWTAWFESLGLKGITTHQTRATLATSLLNNGAPAALVRQLLGHFSSEALAHYANYNNDSMTRYLQQIWAAGPGMDKPGTILLRPAAMNADSASAAAARIDLTAVPVEHGLCRYGPVVGGAHCPFGKNCSNGPQGPCEHFVLTGADLTYWQRKRDAAYHFAEGAPNADARDYILSQWHSWEPVLNALRDALDELGLLEEAEKLDLRAPLHDYFDPLFSTGWQLTQLATAAPAPLAERKQ